MHQTKIKTKSDIILNDAQTKPLNVINQSADYLIEYFEGMLLNYISLNEERGKRMNELKNLILSHNRKDRFKGGKPGSSNVRLVYKGKYHPDYKNYTNDETGRNKFYFTKGQLNELGQKLDLLENELKQYEI